MENLGPAYDRWRTAAPGDDEPDHIKSCPRHEDNHDGELAQCTCPSLDQMKAEAAEARMDKERGR